LVPPASALDEPHPVRQGIEGGYSGHSPCLEFVHFAVALRQGPRVFCVSMSLRPFVVAVAELGLFG